MRSFFITCLLLASSITAVTAKLNELTATSVYSGNYRLNVTLTSATVEPCHFQLVKAITTRDQTKLEPVASISGHGQ